MTWWPWELEARVANLENVVAILARSIGAQDMSRLHDKLATLVSDLNMSADTVIANATESETQFQDIITTLEAVIRKLRQKIEDDASQGSSTGGGSGAR
jgi:uncharacterized coiled-coil protein SlyX